MTTEIQIIVPWGRTKNLGSHYNRLMGTVKDWVCFLDHDILMLNPNWYHMCIHAVEALGHYAGWITGMTNAIACPFQFDLSAPKNSNMVDHMRHAKKRYNQHGERLQMIDPDKIPLEFSGFMILTHKTAWEEAGGFDDGFLGVDNFYHKKLLKAKYTTYVMPGLYMYHLYGTKNLWNSF